MTPLNHAGLEALLPCKCGSMPDIVDDRVRFFARCKNHTPWLVVYGDSVEHLDHITAESDEEADSLSKNAFDAVDWSALRATAIASWNRRAALPVDAEPIAWRYEYLKGYDGGIELWGRPQVGTDDPTEALGSDVRNVEPLYSAATLSTISAERDALRVELANEKRAFALMVENNKFANAEWDKSETSLAAETARADRAEAAINALPEKLKWVIGEAERMADVMEFNSKHMIAEDSLQDAWHMLAMATEQYGVDAAHLRAWIADIRKFMTPALTKETSNAVD